MRETRLRQPARVRACLEEGGGGQKHARQLRGNIVEEVEGVGCVCVSEPRRRPPADDRSQGWPGSEL